MSRRHSNSRHSNSRHSNSRHSNSSRGNPSPQRKDDRGQYHRGTYHPSQPQHQEASAPPSKTRSDDQFIQYLFDRVDTNKSGSLDAAEVQRALSNGAGTAFNPETVRLMMAMFDRRREGSVNRSEFAAMWKYVSEWCNTFLRFDADSSGKIDQDELKRCLSAFGYRLSGKRTLLLLTLLRDDILLIPSDTFYDKLVTRYDRSKTGQLLFDDFLQLCIMLQAVTQTFKEKDSGRRGKITLTYEDFLLMTTDLVMRTLGKV